MPSTILLSPATSSLRTLTLSRLQLDQDESVCTVQTQGEEICLYVLIGEVEIADISSEDVVGGSYGRFGGRRKVTDPGVAVLRLPAGHPSTFDVHLCDFSADILLVSAPGPGSGVQPISHRHDIWAHQVGEGTHQREVREVPTPAGYSISCGETLNIPGGVSSFPPHANMEDLAKFQAGVTTWEEVMFFACPSPGFAVLDGYYSTGQYDNSIIRLENGSAHPMVLGSHAIYSAPDAYIWYFWGYLGNALKKEYRRWSTDVGVYRK